MGKLPFARSAAPASAVVMAQGSVPVKASLVETAGNGCFA